MDAGKKIEKQTSAGCVSGSFSPFHSCWQSFSFDVDCPSLHHKVYSRTLLSTTYRVNPYSYSLTSLTKIGFKNGGWPIPWHRNKKSLMRLLQKVEMAFPSPFYPFILFLLMRPRITAAFFLLSWRSKCERWILASGKMKEPKSLRTLPGTREWTSLRASLPQDFFCLIRWYP